MDKTDTPRVSPVAPLPPEKLYTRCEVSQLQFQSTGELADLHDFIGQPRAASALEFAAGVRRQGYNLFVMGSPGTGKHAMVARFLGERASSEPCPNDWVYVNNFTRAHKPQAIELTSGRGAQLRDHAQRLIDELRLAIPAIFESDEYRVRGERIDAGFNERHEQTFGALSAEAATHQISLLRTPSGYSLAPVKDGEVISTEDYEKLPVSEKKRIEEAIAMLQQKLERAIRSVMQWRKERAELFQQLNREMTLNGHAQSAHASAKSVYDARRQPVLTLYDSTAPAHRALGVAIRMARPHHKPVVVMLVANTDGERAQLRARVEAELQGTGVTVRFQALPLRDADRLKRAALTLHAAAVLWPGLSGVNERKALATLVDELTCPVLLVT